MSRLIAFEFLFTPIASDRWIVDGVPRKRWYIFGFKIIDLVD
jgi:hypothetical protein